MCRFVAFVASFIVLLDNYIRTFYHSIMSLVFAIFSILCLLFLRSSDTGGFLWLHKVGLVIGVKTWSLCAENLQKELKCGLETEQEKDFLGTELVGRVHLGTLEEGKVLLLLLLLS